MKTPIPTAPVLDHLIYATPDLDATVAALTEQLGVRPAAGGQHPGLGTRNALLGIGPRIYLEIVGPDPAQPRPNGPRWFGLDTLDAPRLVTWCAAASDLLLRQAAAHAGGVPLGEVRRGGRVRPDGVALSWEVTSPFTVIARGLVPFLIDWGASPHPALTAPDGVCLRQFTLEHPEPDGVRRQLAVLGIDVPVTAAEQPALVAQLASPRGLVTLR
jgi:hypothetical protein